MASRILRDDPHTPRFKTAQLTRARREKENFGPARSEHYKAWIRTLPCCVCGMRAPSEHSHHGARGMGQKTDDYRSVPLCRYDHESWHKHGHFARPGMDTRRASEEFVAATALTLLVRALRDGIVVVYAASSDEGTPL